MDEAFETGLIVSFLLYIKANLYKILPVLFQPLYLMDTGYFYSSFEYMAWRIKQFLPNSRITFIEDTATTYTTSRNFDEQKVNADKAYLESINPALKIF